MQILNADKSQDFYSYVVNALALAAGGSTSQSFSIDTDSDFYLMKMSMQVDLAGAAITDSTDPIPVCTMQITDGGSSRQLFSQPIPISAIMGKGDNPYILPAPRMFSAGSTVTVSLTNNSAATTYNLRLAFSGIKRYKYGK